MKRIILALLFIIGCNETPAEKAQREEYEVEQQQQFNQRAISGMTYHKDPATNLCFGVYYHYYTNGNTIETVTNVPCTQQVEKLIYR